MSHFIFIPVHNHDAEDRNHNVGFAYYIIHSICILKKINDEMISK